MLVKKVTNFGKGAEMAVKHIKGNEITSITSPANKISLVDFSATWCGPCKMLDPVLRKVSEDLEDRVDFYHVDVDESPEASSQFGIRGVPTMIVFHEGREIERMVGFRDRNAIQRQLEELAETRLTER